MKSKKLIAFLSAVTMLGSAFCTLPVMAEAGDNIVRFGDMEGYNENTLVPHYWGNHSTWRSAEEGGSYVDSVASGADINGSHVLVMSEVTDETNTAGFGLNRGAMQYINDTSTIYNIKAGKSYKVSLTIGNLNKTGESTYQVIFEGAGSPTYENNTVTIAAGETGEIKDALISVAADANVVNASVVIQPVDSKGTFWIDDVSIIEQSDKEYAEGEICDQYSLGLALSGSGDYTVTENFSASSGVTLSDEATGTTGKIDGRNKTITYTNTSNAMLDIEGKAAYDWTFSDMTVSGGGRMLIMNNTAAKATLTNVTFDQSAANCSLINRNGTLTLENVVFPDRTEGYDVLCEWGSGVNVFKGATKARVNRSASYYNIDVTGLTKGADLFIQFNKEHGNAQTDYDNVKGQTISEDLQMVCDDANYTIHITTKADEPVVEPEFAGSVTKVVAANGTGDKADTSATAFETVISNKGGEGTVTSITWDITANETTKSTTANPTEMTLDNGASVNLVLIVNGLYTTENNTVVTVE